MQFYAINPEVAGEYGDDIVLDTSTAPVTVHKLDYYFEVWMGDSLLANYPCFIVSESLACSILQNHLKGTEIADLIVSFSPQFISSFKKEDMPHFVWLKIVGEAGIDDFGLAEFNQLVVSERALKVLKAGGIDHAEVEKFKAKTP